MEVLQDGPKRPRELAEACKVDKVTVRRALDQLFVDGRVQREGHTNSRMYRKAA